MNTKSKRRTVELPCSLGDKLWAIAFNGNADKWEILETPPVKAIAVKPDGVFDVQIDDDGPFLSIYGPLYLSEAAARSAIAWRERLRKETTLVPGMRVRFLDEHEHKVAPGIYPEPGTVGVVVEVFPGGADVQWPAGSTCGRGIYSASIYSLEAVTDEDVVQNV